MQSEGLRVMAKYQGAGDAVHGSAVLNAAHGMQVVIVSMVQSNQRRQPRQRRCQKYVHLGRIGCVEARGGKA
jgi:hypothetical protein